MTENLAKQASPSKALPLGKISSPLKSPFKGSITASSPVKVAPKSPVKATLKSPVKSLSVPSKRPAPAPAQQEQEEQDTVEEQEQEEEEEDEESEVEIKPKLLKKLKKSKSKGSDDDDDFQVEIDEEEARFLDTANIIKSGRRTRGKRIDYSKFGPDKPEDEA